MSDLASQYERQARWRAWTDAISRVPIKPSQRVLDLGCGVGDVAALLHAKRAQVVGVDADESLLAVARARHPAIRFEQMDARELVPESFGRVDGIWSSFVAAYLPDPDAVVSRWRECLAPDGWLALVEVDDLLGHEPMSALMREQIEGFYAMAAADGRYDFRCGGKLVGTVERAGLIVEHDGMLPDHELSFRGSAPAEVIDAWRLRFERMGGFAIAQQLAEAGLEVIVGARDETAGRAAAARIPGARFLQLDVTSDDGIRAAVDALDALDVLVNNAGIADPGDGGAATVTLAVLRRTFEVNFFGAFALTQAMLPLLRRSPAGRVVNVSSSLGSLSLERKLQSFAYRASKAALNMLTVTLAQALAGTPIKVNSAAPGYTITDLNRHLLQPGWTPPPGQTVEEAARTPVRLALLPDDGPTGGFFDKNGSVPW